MSRNLDLDALPLWRRIIFVCGFLLTLTLGTILANKEFDFYVSGAKSPLAVTGEVCPVSVYHDAIRYLPAQEYESYETWKARFCLPLLPAIFVLVTSREFWRAIRETDS
jgi:hypothetical protein